MTKLIVKGLMGFGLLSGVAAGAAADMASAPAKMTVLQKWTLGGEGGWDYIALDSSARRLFVSRATRVDVVATDSGKIVGTIPGTNGVHGIALAEDLKRGYTSNGKGDSITVFDLDSLKIIQEVKIPAHNPDAILYEPVGKHIFTFNGKSKDVTVLDAVKLTVIATLPVPDKPEFAVDDGAGRIYANIESEPGSNGGHRQPHIEDDCDMGLAGLCKSQRAGDGQGRTSAVLGVRRQGHGDYGRIDRKANRPGNHRRRAGCGRIRLGTQAGVQFEWPGYAHRVEAGFG